MKKETGSGYETIVAGVLGGSRGRVPESWALDGISHTFALSQAEFWFVAK